MAAGSVLGVDHRRADRANQDAFVVQRTEHALVAVVADGCGSGRRSEVGAVLGAELYAQATLEAVTAGGRADDPGVLMAIEARVTRELSSLLPRLASRPGRLVSDCFLFTLVCGVITRDHASVTALGDGVAVWNGERRILGPFPHNQPPYLGYRLLSERDGDAPESVVVFHGETDALDTLIIGTDGALPLMDEHLASIVEDPRIFRNADALRRRLAQHNREAVSVDWEAQRVSRSSGPLADDTTLVVMRRTA